MEYKFTVKSPEISEVAYLSPKAIYGEFKYLEKIDQETVWLVGLNNLNKCILKENIFKGTINESTCDPKLIFRHLLLAGAIKFVIIHNHPGGETIPSEHDRVITKKLKNIGEIIGIKLIDHIIIGNDYYSFTANE